MTDNELPIVSAKSTFLDWPSPDDMALIVYIAGCKHNCKNCQSPDLQNAIQYPGVPVEDAIEILYELAKKHRTEKIVFSGGDPLYHSIQLQKIIDGLKEKHKFFRFCIYTGFEYEEAINLISGFDFIKTGKYDCEQHQVSMKDDFKMILASKNQKFYNAKGKLLTKNGILKFK